ncbi:hypothetical protein PG291_10075 [Riemerella anatipestifer]|nr:hypothetical protein [Riemerella anatipestifer]
MKKHRKIYYVGGMISLIFIPIIFWIYAKPTYDNLNLRVLDLGLPYKAKKGEKLSEYMVIPIDGYKYDVVNVPTNFNEETEKKYFALIEKIKKQNIDKTGIKFQFSNENSYGDLVKLINLMQKTNQESFGMDTEKTNAFYFVHRKIEYNDENNIAVCGGVLGREYLDKNDYDYRHSNFIQKIVTYSPKETYYLILGYLILSCFSINKLIKFNKMHCR